MPGLPVYSTKQAKLEQEIRNGANQILKALSLVETWQVGDLNTALLCEFQQVAITQIYTCAGTLRDGPVSIQGVKHQPPPHTEVPALVQEMCDYINNNWGRTAIHLSAYLMWRVNWIHPFYGGNGRTAHVIAYLILSAKLGFKIPGTVTIPDLIDSERGPYYDALRKADTAFESGKLDISSMEELMSSMLAKQLVGVHKQAAGTQV